MRGEAHQTLIGIVRHHVVEWRRREDWSRETVAQVIVEAHERIGGPASTGIRFEPRTTDAFARQKVNADKIFRWLDDETKDANFLPANFLRSILAAMPDDVRLACVDDVLQPLGMAARRTDGAIAPVLDVMAELMEVIREDAESQQAIAGLLRDREPEAIESALREINESIEKKREVRMLLEALLAGKGA